REQELAGRTRGSHQCVQGARGISESYLRVARCRGLDQQLCAYGPAKSVVAGGHPPTSRGGPAQGRAHEILVRREIHTSPIHRGRWRAPSEHRFGGRVEHAGYIRDRFRRGQISEGRAVEDGTEPRRGRRGNYTREAESPD